MTSSVGLVRKSLVGSNAVSAIHTASVRHNRHEKERKKERKRTNKQCMQHNPMNYPVEVGFIPCKEVNNVHY